MLGRLRMDVGACIAAYLSLSERVFTIPWYLRSFNHMLDMCVRVQAKMHLGRSKTAIQDFIEQQRIAMDSELLKAAMQDIIEEQNIDMDALLQDNHHHPCRA